MDLAQTLAVLAEFRRAGVHYKIVGGVALNLLGLPRATKDLDVFVAPTEDNVARLRAALHAVFDDPTIDEITAVDLAGDYPAIQYVPPTGEFHIDILARLGDRFGYDDIEIEPRQLEGLTLPVATPTMLYRMKRDTVRLQDKADAERLRKRFDLEE